MATAGGGPLFTVSCTRRCRLFPTRRASPASPTSASPTSWCTRTRTRWASGAGWRNAFGSSRRGCDSNTSKVPDACTPCSGRSPTPFADHSELQRELNRVELEARNQPVPFADADRAHVPDLPPLGQHARQPVQRGQPRLDEQQEQPRRRILLHEFRRQPLVCEYGIRLHCVTVQREEWRDKHEIARHPLPEAKKSVALDVIRLENGVVAGRRGLLVADQRGGHVPAFPSCELSPHAQIQIFEVAEKVLVEPADPIEHRFAQRAGAAVRCEDLFGAIVLAHVLFLPPS